MKTFPCFEKPNIIEALVCFYDITNFTQIVKKLNNALSVVEFIQQVSYIVSKKITETCGKIIKYIGDAGIIIFPDECVDEGVNILIQTQKEMHDFFISHNLNNRTTFSIHYGEIAIGKLEPFTKMDIFGDTVNVAATLERQSNYKGKFIMSPQVFRKLNPKTRKLVHKFTPPVVYILN